MASTKPKALSSSKRAAELDTLIKSFRAAQDAGDRTGAVRFIDRAWRIAPKNPELNHLYGLMLISEGHLDRGIALLDSVLSENPDPNIEALCISALYRGAFHEHARTRLEKAFARYAVAHDGELARIAGIVTSESAPRYAGWIAFAPDLSVHGEIFAAEGPVCVRVWAGSSVIGEQAVTRDAPSQTQTFTFPLKTLPTDRRMTATSDSGELVGRNLSFPPDFGFDGGTPAFDGGQLISFDKTISGWARLAWDPRRALDLSVSDERRTVAKLPTHADPLNPGRHNFTLKPHRLGGGRTLTVSATMPDGTTRDLPGSPILIDSTSPPPPPAQSSRPSEAEAIRGIDIVIPVYSGLTETLDCIRAVRKTVPEDVNIIVVDDATPNTALAAALDALAANKAITLLRNPHNLGFPGSANRGLRLNPEQDVVILNADTEVFGNWLSRLRTAVYSAPEIGTATPLTNAGSIASYPASGRFDPDHKTAAAIDRLAKDVNKNTTIDIPTGVGFCLFIRRDCLREVGYFDDETFGKGYGEENDFCLRASSVGWRHVLAADIYVRHVGGRSFGDRKNALYERNLRLLFLRYPAYHALTDTFGERDPAHTARRRLDAARLHKMAGRSALIVSLALDGGAQRAADERAAALRSAGLTPIILKPLQDAKDGWTLTVTGADFEDLRYELDNDLEDFLSLLKSLDLDHVELHHFLDLAPVVIEGILSLPCPVDIYIHDYIWYCPRITLLDGNSRYCEEPPVAACEVCISKNGSRLTESISVPELRKRSLRWLSVARRLIVPAPSVAARMKVQFPQLAFQVEPLEAQPTVAAPIAPVAGRRIKIATIGAIGDHKGYGRLLEMAQHAARNDLPLDFVVIGHTRDDRALFDTGRVFVTGEYKEHEIGALISREAPDLALFLSEFPETWCYSLTHALEAELPVAALDLGALGDRLRSLSAPGLLLPLSATATELCALIMAAFAAPAWNHRTTGGHNIRNEASSQRDKHGNVLDIPTLPNREEILRKDMATQLDPQPASVNFLPLTRGLFLFSVKSSQPPVTVDSQNGVALPAMQLSPAPAASSGQIEFVSAPNTASAWLSYPHDRIVVRVTVPSAVMLLSSIAGPGMTPVEVEIQRLDIDTPETSGSQAVALPPVPTTQTSIGLKVTAHIQNRGDLEFAQSQWVNADGERFWIESFSILPLETLSPDQIEYKAVTATGVETPWITNGASCGTRGIGVPLTGFAVRLKADAGAQGACEYGAILLSGALIGPLSDGTLCRSQNPQDPIVGLWVAIDAKAVQLSGGTKVTAAEPQKTEKPAATVSTAAGTPKPAGENRDKSAVGPRFSIFRDPGKSK